MKVHEVFGTTVHDLSQDELVRSVSDWLEGDRPRVIVTPNPEFVLAARKDWAFRDLLNRADLSLPDGVGLRFAVAALTDDRLGFRHTGVDTLALIAQRCAAQEKNLVLLGGEPGVAERAASSLRGRVPGLRVSAVDPGRVSGNGAELAALEELERATVVAVGLGQGKQERVMETLRTSVPSNLPLLRLLIGVGGAFDMLAGTRRRAPIWIRRAGLEWVWRLVIEPRRWKRIFHAFPVFPMVVIRDTLRHRRFLRACRAAVPEIIRQLRGL